MPKTGGILYFPKYCRDCWRIQDHAKCFAPNSGDLIAPGTASIAGFPRPTCGPRMYFTTNSAQRGTVEAIRKCCQVLADPGPCPRQKHNSLPGARPKCCPPSVLAGVPGARRVLAFQDHSSAKTKILPDAKNPAEIRQPFCLAGFVVRTQCPGFNPRRPRLPNYPQYPL